MRDQALTEKQQKFVIEYCVDLHCGNAARRAGYSERTADDMGSQLHCNPKIKAAIDERMADMAVAQGITTQKVLRKLFDIAFADPNELAQVRHVCCRHCWGENFEYQWTQAEFLKAVEASLKAAQPIPSNAGGMGFDATKDPNPACPNCHGEGLTISWLADTRKLTGQAKAVYAGTKMTKDGITILLRDQDKALAILAQHLGIVGNKVEVSGPGGGPVPVAEMSTEQLEKFIAAGIKGDDSK